MKNVSYIVLDFHFDRVFNDSILFQISYDSVVIGEITDAFQTPRKTELVPIFQKHSKVFGDSWWLWNSNIIGKAL